MILYLNIIVIGSTNMRRATYNIRKINALPMFLIALMLEYPSWSKNGVSGSSLSASKVNILSKISSPGRMSN